MLSDEHLLREQGARGEEGGARALDELGQLERQVEAGQQGREEAAPHGEGSGLAGQNGASHSGLRGRFPRLSELLRFVRGQRDVKGGSGAGGGAAAVTSSKGALCLPSKQVGS